MPDVEWREGQAVVAKMDHPAYDATMRTHQVRRGTMGQIVAWPANKARQPGTVMVAWSHIAEPVPTSALYLQPAPTPESAP
jgi:hypothetical protein